LLSRSTSRSSTTGSGCTPASATAPRPKPSPSTRPEQRPDRDNREELSKILDTAHTTEWLVTLREAVRRRYLDAVTTLARITIDNKPEQTLDLLETARNLEPLNEAIYRDIIRIQQRLGRPDAAAATFQLLHAQLADIDATPSPATVRPRAQNRGTRLHRIDNPRTPRLPYHHVLAATFEGWRRRTSSSEVGESAGQTVPIAMRRSPGDGLPPQPRLRTAYLTW